MGLILAAPFATGGLLAAVPLLGERASARILKAPFGLLAGDGPADRLLAARDRLVGLPEVGAASLAETLSEGGSRWLLSLEGALRPGEAGSDLATSPSSYPGREEGLLGGPVALWRLREGELRRVYWGAVVPPPGLPEEVRHEAELRLQWELEQGTGVDARMAALLAVVAWLGKRLPELGPDCELGIHEPGHFFSVDRVGWRRD